ncbi:MAG: SIMPL domain-containing protein [Microgenomates group bacterium]|jgi:uncharacterized protein YggE
MNNTLLKALLGVFVLLVLVKIFNIAYPINIRVVNTSESAEFTVMGTGKVTVIPDVAVIDAGVTVSNASSAESAKSLITSVNNKIITTVKLLGVEKKDIETSSFNIYPEYSTTTIQPLILKGSAQPAVESTEAVRASSKISGYNGSVTITMKVRNKDVVSQVIQKVTEAGGTNVSGPRFTIDDRSIYQQKARSLAILDAKGQAQKLAKELGIKLGKVTNMVESGAGPYYDYSRGLSAMDSSAKAVEAPVFEEGSDIVTSSVTLFFERK